MRRPTPVPQSTTDFPVPPDAGVVQGWTGPGPPVVRGKSRRVESGVSTYLDTRDVFTPAEARPCPPRKGGGVGTGYTRVVSCTSVVPPGAGPLRSRTGVTPSLASSCSDKLPDRLSNLRVLADRHLIRRLIVTWVSLHRLLGPSLPTHALREGRRGSRTRPARPRVARRNGHPRPW